MAVHGPALIWTAAAAWFLVSPVGSTYGPPGLELVRRPMDLFGHAGLFAAGAMLVDRSLRRVARMGRPLLWACVLVLAYGTLLEGLQAFVPGRWPQLADALANSLGVVAYAAVRWPRRAVR